MVVTKRRMSHKEREREETKENTARREERERERASVCGTLHFGGKRRSSAT